MADTGPLARDLDDLELLLRITSGPDCLDSDVPPVPLGAQPRLPMTGLRLSHAATLPGCKVAHEIRQQIERVAAEAASAGAAVDERLPDMDWEGQYRLFCQLVSTITGLFDPTSSLPDEQRTLAWYMGALDRRDRFIATWNAFFADIDALILPPAITTAFTHRDFGAPLDVDGSEVEYGDNGRPLVVFNVAGVPALVVPAGFDRAGLPIGIQIVGPRWSETRLLAIARTLEDAAILPGFHPPPGY